MMILFNEKWRRDPFLIHFQKKPDARKQYLCFTYNRLYKSVNSTMWDRLLLHATEFFSPFPQHACSGIAYLKSDGDDALQIRHCRGFRFLFSNIFHSKQQGARINSAASKEICTLGLFSGEVTKAFARLKSQQTKTWRSRESKRKNMQTQSFCWSQIDLIRKNVHVEPLFTRRH